MLSSNEMQEFVMKHDETRGCCMEAFSVTKAEKCN